MTRASTFVQARAGHGDAGELDRGGASLAAGGDHAIAVVQVDYGT